MVFILNDEISSLTMKSSGHAHCDLVTRVGSRGVAQDAHGASEPPAQEAAGQAEPQKTPRRVAWLASLSLICRGGSVDLPPFYRGPPGSASQV